MESTPYLSLYLYLFPKIEYRDVHTYIIIEETQAKENETNVNM